ncbi:hypothetical protein DFJ73DRAFT_825597 [Zopfochytrium polystomum]|nr:hypothetical protein DFJ73DRAFT_825597 [Zopfochytrium polystomum]
MTPTLRPRRLVLSRQRCGTPPLKAPKRDRNACRALPLFCALRSGNVEWNPRAFSANCQQRPRFASISATLQPRPAGSAFLVPDSNNLDQSLSLTPSSLPVLPDSEWLQLLKSSRSIGDKGDAFRRVAEVLRTMETRAPYLINMAHVRVLVAAAVDSGLAKSGEGRSAFIDVLQQTNEGRRWFPAALNSYVSRLVPNDPLLAVLLVKDAAYSSGLWQPPRDRLGQRSSREEKQAYFNAFMHLLTELEAVKGKDDGFYVQARIAILSICAEFNPYYPPHMGRLVEVLAKSTRLADDIEDFPSWCKKYLKRRPSPDSYTYLIGNAVRAGADGLARHLLRLAESEFTELKATYYQRLIKELVESGGLVFALELCLRFRNEGMTSKMAIRTTEQLMQSLRDSKERYSADVIATVLDSINDELALYLSLDSFLYAIQYSLTQLRDFNRGTRFLNLMKAKHAVRRQNAGPTSHSKFEFFLQLAYELFLQELSKSYDAGRTLETYNEMVMYGLLPNKRVYSIMLNHLAYQFPTEAGLILSDMEKRNRGQLDTVIYTSLISKHVKAGRLPQALELLKRMKDLHIQPNIFTYNSLIAGLSDAGLFNEASRLMRRMEHLGSPPDIVTYNTILDGLLSYGRWKEASGVLNIMAKRNLKYDKVTFGILIANHLTRLGGDYSAALSLFQQMQDAPYSIQPDVAIYDSFLDYYCRLQDWNKVFAHLNIGRVPIDSGGEEWKSYFPAGSSPPVSWKSYVTAIREMASFGELDLADRVIAAYEEKYGTFKLIGSLAALIRAVARAEERKMIDSGHGEQEQEETKGASDLSRRWFPRRLARARGYYERLAQANILPNDEVNAAIIACFTAIGDFRGGVRWANWALKESGTGKSTLQAIRQAAVRHVRTAVGNSGLPINEPSSMERAQSCIGRASCYSLMLLHAKSGSASDFQSVYAQLKRFEEWGAIVKRTSEEADVSIDESNVLIQCYGYLKDLNGAISVWDKCWKPSGRTIDEVRFQLSDATDADSRDLSASSALLQHNVSEDSLQKDRILARANSRTSLQLAHLFGVDRLTVSVILDCAGFAGDAKTLDEIWKSVLDARFPLDVNNYISYGEALARCGESSRAYRAVFVALKEAGWELTPKCFWSLIPLLDGIDARKARALLNRCDPSYIREVTRVAPYLFS